MVAVRRIKVPAHEIQYGLPPELGWLVGTLANQPSSLKLGTIQLNQVGNASAGSRDIGE